MKNLFILLIVLFLVPIYSQSHNGVLKGKMTDEDSGESLVFANVALFQNGQLVTGVQTDFYGDYIIADVVAGTYDVKFSYTGYPEQIISDITIHADDTTLLDNVLTQGVELGCVKIIEYKKPLIEQDNTSSGSTLTVRGSRISTTDYYLDGIRLTSKDIRNLPTRNINALASLTAGSASSKEAKSQENKYAAGQLTATEVNDFGDWEFWSAVNESNFIQHSVHWKMNPAHRVSVQLKNLDGFPVQDLSVELLDESDQILWSAKSDNLGIAELFYQYFDDVAEKEPKSIQVKKGDDILLIEKVDINKTETQVLTVDALCEKKEIIELVFLTDISGSMSDELKYLKEEIVSIVKSVQSENQRKQIRVGMVFFQGHNDANTIQFFDFVDDPSLLKSEMQKISGSGGADEAMDLALATSLDSFSWSKESHKLTFILGDEVLNNVEENRKRLRDKTKSCAEMGIKIVPIGCSDMNKELEYVMRSMAIATGGTYLALTDDSGIGNKHIKPTTKKFDVMPLNDLLKDVIMRFTTDHSCLAESKIADQVWSPAYKLNASLGHESEKIKLRLFPNPVRDIINFSGLHKKKIKALFVCDLSGRIVKKLDKSAPSFSVQDLASGTYFVLASTKDDGFVSERFLKIQGESLSANGL